MHWKAAQPATPQPHPHINCDQVIAALAVLNLYEALFIRKIDNSRPDQNEQTINTHEGNQTHRFAGLIKQRDIHLYALPCLANKSLHCIISCKQDISAWLLCSCIYHLKASMHLELYSIWQTQGQDLESDGM